MNIDHSDELEKPEEELEDKNSNRTKGSAVLNRTGCRCAAHTAGCPPPPQARDTRHQQGARRPDGQVGLPEGTPDRCNPDRCPADPTEGVIPRRFQG